METIRDSFVAGARASLKQAHNLPRRYFAPLIALGNWMYEVTERVMQSRQPQRCAPIKHQQRH
jgi:hypothetical protein